jgi:diguanylate cyclase (GGDEF)-like protein
MIVLQEYALNKVLVIDANTPYKINTIDDSASNGGASKGIVTKKNNNLLLDCTIVHKNYPWPFCELTIDLRLGDDEDNHLGTDLSSFDRLKITAKYLGETSAGIRFQIRSYNDIYSDINAQNTWKYNGLEYWPESSPYPTEIPMNVLQVATWWLIEQEIPIDLSAPEFEHSMIIEIATGNNIAAGQYLLEVEELSFHGKIFKSQHIYALLISLWILTAIFILYSQIKRSNNQLTKVMRRTVELKQLNKLLNIESQTLKDKAERDPLTGALNRSGIQPIFTQELQELSLIFIDIDHFKTINDTHGHAVGDEILKAFVKLINENCRSTDFLARWGGEEFLLVCPNTNRGLAEVLAEDIRRLVEAHTWTNNIKMTSSFGVAQRHKESPTAFIERADKALYDAKARGRNQVVVARIVNQIL